MTAPETLSQMLDTVSDEYPDEEALVQGDRRLTYPEFRDRAVEFAGGLLDLGVGKGDHVGLMVSTRIEWFVATYALQYIGATAVGLNTWYKRHELERTLEKTDVSTLITLDSFEGNDYLDMLETIAPDLAEERTGQSLNVEPFPYLNRVVVIGDDRDWTLSWDDVVERGTTVDDEVVESAAESVTRRDPAYIMFSSGTTGEPKAIVLKHEGLVTNPVGIGERLDVTHEDRFLDPIPLFFSLASCHETITALYHGATLVLQERFDAREAVDLIEREECTIIYGVHNMFRQMEALDVDLEEKFETLRLLQGLAPSSVRRRFIEEYDVDDTITGFGLTETSAVAALQSTDDPLEAKLNTYGRPLPNTDIRIKDPETGEELLPGEEGEICIRARTLFKEYYNQPVKTREAVDREGYLKTGDLGWLTADGRLVWEGRMDEMIKTSGINVSPKEVENLLCQHPSVEEAVVFGVPDEERDEVVAAAVLTSEEVDPGDIIAFCRERVASYKIPAIVNIHEDFPRTGSGKVRKEVVEERFERDD